MTSQTNGQFDRTPLIAGNWKMNMDHAQAITLLQKLAWTLDDAKHDYSRAEVAVFPPFTDLRSVQSLVDGDDLRVVYGAQDLSDQDSGAYTGDISGQFLARLGCTYVLVGHSERRTIHGESDELCNAKIAAAHRHGLVPVLCVGEGLEVRQAGEHVAFTLEQLRGSIAGLEADPAIGYKDGPPPPVPPAPRGETYKVTFTVQELATAVELGLPVAIVIAKVFGEHQRIVYANLAFETLTGIAADQASKQATVAA